MHIGVFILLLLSGERNFGVRLNKPYSVHVPMDIPVFTGTHADLLIVVRRRLTTLVFVLFVHLSGVQRLPVLQVFHKIITTGHQRLQPLFDCLLTIIVNGEWPLNLSPLRMQRRLVVERQVASIQFYSRCKERFIVCRDYIQIPNLWLIL